MKNAQRHPSLLLDLLIVVIAAGLLVAVSQFGFEAGHPARPGAGSVFGGVYILYLGMLFLLSYFFPRQCFVFSFLSRICVLGSRPAGQWMAWFYFALSVALGSNLLLIGFGVL